MIIKENKKAKEKHKYTNNNSKQKKDCLLALPASQLTFVPGPDYDMVNVI